MVKCEKCGTDYKVSCHVCYPDPKRMERMCDNIIEEADRRIITAKHQNQRTALHKVLYQNRSAAIHEVIMDVNAKIEEVIRDKRYSEPWRERRTK